MDSSSTKSQSVCILWLLGNDPVLLMSDFLASLSLMSLIWCECELATWADSDSDFFNYSYDYFSSSEVSSSEEYFSKEWLTWLSLSFDRIYATLQKLKYCLKIDLCLSCH